MNNFKVVKYQPVEIFIPAGSTQTQFVFPNQPSLNNKRILAIETYLPDVLAKSPLTFNNNLDMVDFNNAVVEFYVGNQQQAYRLPLLKLNNIQGAVGQTFSRDLFETESWFITWDKCNLVFTAPLTQTNRTVTIGVYYMD